MTLGINYDIFEKAGLSSGIPKIVVYVLADSNQFVCSNQNISWSPHTTIQEHFSKNRNANFGRILANVPGFFQAIT